MTEQVPAAASADPDFCRAVLPRVSRTFAVSIEALPPGLREAVRTAYLLCRIVDTVEDQVGLAPADRAALYDAFDQALVEADAPGAGALAAAARFERLAQRHALDADGAGGALCARAGAVFGAFARLPATERAAIRPHVARMSSGMRGFSVRAERFGRLRLRDVADLEQYCYVVAGTVGELLTALFELAVPGLPQATRAALWDRAVSFGLGLQMVNIVKDVAEDYRRGDVFLPESLAAQQGVVLEELLRPEQRGAGLRVVREVSSIARSHLERAREYALLWPAQAGRDVRLFCAVPLALALATLREVDDGDATLRTDRAPKVSRGAVARVVAEVSLAVADDAALGAVLDRCARGEFR